MSTILAALQKQKSAAGGPFVPPGAEKGLFKWRVALLTSLLVTISLLSALLYLQLIGAVEDNKMPQPTAPDKAQDVIEVDSDIIPPAVNEMPVNITKTVPKAVREMTFATQPLPEVKKPESQIIRVQDEINLGTENLKGELDYSAVSDDLQQRFELALQGSTEQDKVPSVDISHDGRDLNEMARKFQQKVPSIKYETHLYSSIAQERWIKVNGEKLREGQFDAQGKIQLLEIQPNRSIFRLGRQSFSLESLTDWKGY